MDHVARRPVTAWPNHLLLVVSYVLAALSFAVGMPGGKPAFLVQAFDRLVDAGIPSFLIYFSPAAVWCTVFLVTLLRRTALAAWMSLSAPFAMYFQLIAAVFWYPCSQGNCP